MTTDLPRVVIAGAGHAGGTAADLLRQGGFSGDIILVGEEPIAPYQRPPLSKAYLQGQEDADTLKLRPDDFYADRRITLRLGESIAAVDRLTKNVRTTGGETLAYDHLILATGSRPRRPDLPGITLAGVHYLRSIADADRLKAAIRPGRRIVLIGGGYIGLEVAASAPSLGASAVVIERESRVLARVASAALSGYLERYHRSKGVEILTGAQVAGLESDESGNVARIRLADGRLVPCDVAIVCVGSSPCDELARAAGLPCERGVVVDHDSRTADPAIFAIGDVAVRAMPLYDGRMFNLESVPNALEQARQACAAILGKARPKPETPWFWSHQFDVSLQIAGLLFEADDIVVRGDPVNDEFAVFHLQDGRIVTVEAVNAPMEFMAGRKLIGRRASIARELLADPDVSVTSLISRQTQPVRSAV